MRVLVIIPAYNEEANILRTVDNLKENSKNVLIIDAYFNNIIDVIITGVGVEAGEYFVELTFTFFTVLCCLDLYSGMYWETGTENIYMIDSIYKTDN